MSHSDQIWPALACLRRGELPCPAGIDALEALAQGRVQAPPQPRLFAVEDAEPLEAEWCAAYKAEYLCAPPRLPQREVAALRGAERDRPARPSARRPRSFAPGSPR